MAFIFFTIAICTFFLYSTLCEEINLYPPDQTDSDPYGVSQAGENRTIMFKVRFKGHAKPISFEKQRKEYQDYFPMCELSDFKNCGKPTTKSCYCVQKIDDENYIVAYNLTLYSFDSEAHIKAIFTHYNGPVITSPEVTLPKIEERGRNSTSEVSTQSDVIIVACVLGILLIVFFVLFIICWRRSNSLKRKLDYQTGTTTQDKAKDKGRSHTLDGNRDEQQVALSDLTPSDEVIDVRANKTIQKRV